MRVSNRRLASKAIGERVAALPELESPRGLLACLSFGEEPDTWALIETLARRGHRLHVPRARARDKSLRVVPWPCRLVELPFGLKQPPPGEPELSAAALLAEIEILLLPGLAFDRELYRLGSGAGYFDRFLASGAVTAIGLAFDEQVLPELPREAHDLPMDLIVTPTEILRPMR